MLRDEKISALGTRAKFEDPDGRAGRDELGGFIEGRRSRNMPDLSGSIAFSA
jgi:hypothetical protein